MPADEMYKKWNFSTNIDIDLNMMCNESFNENKSKVELNSLFLLKSPIERVLIANLLLLLSLKQILRVESKNYS